MFLKTDMEKAFDRMEWNFILEIMRKLGFPPIWINWIRICIFSPSFSILINGSPFGLFSPARGLRQGNPLSPFLFILGSEVFSQLLVHVESQDFFKGLKIAKICPIVSHLLFADDLLVFCRAFPSKTSCIRDCFDKYSHQFGQSTNVSKSSIHFSKNTNPNSIRNILSILPFIHNPSKSVYLGLPILFGSSKTLAFHGIIDKVQRKIEGWRAKSLSQARTVLLKSEAASIPTYTMNTFLLPQGFCSSLDRMFKNFFVGLSSWKVQEPFTKILAFFLSSSCFGWIGLPAYEGC